VARDRFRVLPLSVFRSPAVPSKRTPDTANRAFTLVEILIVIAIVGILAALGYPAVQKGVQAANSAKCVANLRTIGLAAQQFANDNNGRILTWGDGNSTPFPRWMQGLAPTLGNTGPEAQWTGATLETIYRPLACPCIPGAYRWPSSASPYTYAANSFYNPDWGWPEFRRLNFDKPGSTIYLVDGWATFATFPGQDIVDQGWPPPAFPPPSMPNAVLFPHQGKCNALFLDGHVESFSKRIPAKYIRP